MPLLHWLEDPPTLDRGLLLVCMTGFIDAGSAGETAALFLRHRWQSEVVARFDRDAFLDYRARRPTAIVDGGRLRRIDWPDLELCVARLAGAGDVALLLGPEPDMRWESFCDTVAETCKVMGVVSVMTLGAYPAAAPHTRPTRITRIANTAAEASELPDAEDVPGYTGPVGAATVLQHAMAGHGLPCVGLWAEVPHYISASAYPEGALALVRAVADVVAVPVDTTELEAAATAHRQQVDEAVAEHPEAADMITALERATDLGMTTDLPSGDDLADEIERFLRGRDEPHRP